jgi:hypothetical protein
MQQQQHHDEPQISTLNSDTLSDIQNKLPMNIPLPTYYYKITVNRGHHQNVIYRSYKQFEWLYQQLRMITLKENPQSKKSFETITIPHPLQGNRSKDHCSFLGGQCWLVRQIQEFLDYFEQQQQQNKDSTTTASKNEIAGFIDRGHYHSKFAETRCQRLSYFLTTVLEQHGRSSSSSSTPTIIYANHVAVLQFLELSSNEDK